MFFNIVLFWEFDFTIFFSFLLDYLILMSWVVEFGGLAQVY